MPIDRQLAGREHVVEPGRELGAADAAREQDDVHARSTQRGLVSSRRKGRPLEVGGGVDVVAEIRQVEVVHELEPERGGVRPEPGGAAGPVERLERRGEREAERVRRPVGGGDDRERAGARRGGERREVGRRAPAAGRR